MSTKKRVVACMGAIVRYMARGRVLRQWDCTKHYNKLTMADLNDWYRDNGVITRDWEKIEVYALHVQLGKSSTLVYTITSNL